MIDAIGNWAFTIFAVICGLAGSAALVYGLVLFIKENRRCTFRTTGRVIQTLYDYSDSYQADTNGTAMCGLRLEVELNGETLQVFNDQYSSSYCRYREGDIVPVRINPGNPNEYIVTDGSASPGLFLLLLGLGMLVAAFMLIRWVWF